MRLTVGRLKKFLNEVGDDVVINIATKQGYGRAGGATYFKDEENECVTLVDEFSASLTELLNPESSRISVIGDKE